MPTCSKNEPQRKCKTPSCKEMITGQSIYCKRCVKERKQHNQNIARGYSAPPPPPTDYKWLKSAGSFLSSAKANGLSYAQAQIQENREKGLIK